MTELGKEVDKMVDQAEAMGQEAIAPIVNAVTPVAEKAPETADVLADQAKELFQEAGKKVKEVASHLAEKAKEGVAESKKDGGFLSDIEEKVSEIFHPDQK